MGADAISVGFVMLRLVYLVKQTNYSYSCLLSSVHN